MCGRFTLTVNPADLQDAFKDYTFPTKFAPRFNIAPTQPILAIPNDDRHEADFFVWGLIPMWAKDPGIGNRLINARAETLAEKPAFRGGLKHKRCLILADGFYEWKAGPGSKTKTPYFIHMNDRRPFAFAGLWDSWNSQDGSQLKSCTIITTEPNDLMSLIHDRMPVILHPRDYDKWLDPSAQTPESLRPYLKPYPAQEMNAYPVSTLVNKPANDRPELVVPVNSGMATAISYSITRRFPALASRDYALFLVGQLVSVIGTWMQATALPYLAYRITGRPLDLGIIGFSNTLPTLLFALPAGVLVERWDKRKTVILFQAIMSIQAFGLAFLVYTGQIQIWHIVLLAFVYGSAVAVEVTARQSMLVELTGKDALSSAIALQSTAFNVGRVIGPLVAAWIIASTGGEAGVFLANGLSYLFVIGGLIAARTRYKVPQQEVTERSLRAEFNEGLAYIRRNVVVMSVILTAALIGFFGIPLIQQIPALARDVLTTAADTEAVIASRTSSLYAAQGVGALIAAFLAVTMAASSKNKMLTLGQVTFVLPVILLGLVRDLNIALALLALIGWGTVTQLVTMNTIVQTQSPDHLRGRVFSIYFWALQGVAPFGSIVIGWIAQVWNVPIAAVISGTICLLGIVVIRMLLGNGGQSSP